MPRISLWKPDQREDYNFIDRSVREHFNLGATGVFVHRYMGVGDSIDDAQQGTSLAPGIDELDIGDVLFLENRNRRYDPNIYELRGSYIPADTDLDLSQFGIFLSDDTVRVVFHLNEMVDRLGRKLMAGDVLELPHLREYFGLDEDRKAINRFYVVEDASYPSEGFGPRWWNHMWRVRAKMLTDSPEFEDILSRVLEEDGTTRAAGPDDDCCDDTIGSVLSQGNNDQAVTDSIITEAEHYVEYDPLWYRSNHFYVFDDEGRTLLVPWRSGDSVPPNGTPVAGVGDTFPETMAVGDYFLRTDFVPAVLYQKQSECRFVKIQTDQARKPWTAANAVADHFVQNTQTVIADDGTEVVSRQALSKLLKPQAQQPVDAVMIAPTAFVAEPVSSNPAVQLTWNTNNVGQQFRVYRATSLEDLLQQSQPLVRLSITANSYLDTDTDPATVYYYRVSAADSVRELFSNTDEALTVLGAVVTTADQYITDQQDQFITENDSERNT